MPDALGDRQFQLNICFPQGRAGGRMGAHQEATMAMPAFLQKGWARYQKLSPDARILVGVVMLAIGFLGLAFAG